MVMTVSMGHPMQCNVPLAGVGALLQECSVEMQPEVSHLNAQGLTWG